MPYNVHLYKSIPFSTSHLFAAVQHSPQTPINKVFDVHEVNVLLCPSCQKQATQPGC